MMIVFPILLPPGLILLAWVLDGFFAFRSDVRRERAYAEREQARVAAAKPAPSRLMIRLRFLRAAVFFGSVPALALVLIGELIAVHSHF
jgi:hypothetical protein